MRRSTIAICVGVALGLARGVPSAAAARTPEPSRAGAESRRALYGTVVTDSGKRYTGPMRWGDEEAFWDDVFDAVKEDLPYIDRLPEDKRPRHRIRFIGFLPIGFEDEGETGRRFSARFGDIQEIRPQGGDSVVILMKSGTKVRLAGGSDVGAVLHLEDPKAGGLDLNWEGIDRIVLEPAPARTAEPKARGLYGKVVTSSDTFQGFILWDGQECLSTDRLDGDGEDGRISLEMGTIRSIEKRSPESARVETSDGRTLDLRGTNDVNEQIRGIFVEDERYGRVMVSWDAFRRVDFRDAAGAGRTYADYLPGRTLRGTVLDRDGKKWQGRLIFDLDESETWEMLDGARQGVDYSVPFERIRTLEPGAGQATMVSLRNGQKLRLEGTQDVGAKNAGVLVMASGDKPEHYVPWAQVTRIDLD